ncbi:hypothetical protein ACRALDRAFT_2024980 [Sodiomyces alcalophilus JCM 7366]|uniref:uncharacterized protein n=1 Tax=Sodiomyces alcalophilus JCM 7366 TaxID=591952 RepID=UPI0039B41872
MAGRHDAYGMGQGHAHGHLRPPPGFSAPTPDLENRLRNLILSNTVPGETTTQSAHPFADPSHAPAPEAPGPPVPPQTNSSFSPYSGHETLPASASPDAPLGPQSAPAPPKTSRKRPNQAQRRQMNSHLVIPIDPRPAHPWANRRQGNRGNNGNHPPSQGQAHGSWGLRSQHAHPPGHSDPSDQSVPASSRTTAGRHHHHGQSPRNNAPQVPHHHNSIHRHPTSGIPPGPSGDIPPPFPRRQHHGNLYEPHGVNIRPEQVAAQSAFLENLCHTIVRDAEIDRSDIIEKEAFRLNIEEICRKAIAEHEEQTRGKLGFPATAISLKCFGSLSSGFATKASDMDLGLISPFSQPQPDAPDSEIPRLIEKAFLAHGLGARLLTRTRVPIIKVCEKPTQSLLRDLLEARETWEAGLDGEGGPGGADPAEHMDDTDHLGQEPATGTQKGSDQLAAGPTVATAATTNGISATDQESCPTSALEPSSPFELRQSEGQSLVAYHVTAKRALRRLQGRDLTMSNHREFSREDFELLNRVCAAFIQGIRDPVLKARLQNYPSIDSLTSPSPSAPDHNHHSLQAVFSQAEGERLVMLWENRGTFEKNSDQEKMADGVIKDWKLTQSRDTSGMDPISFTKLVQIHLEKLRKVHSIQLLTLQQDQGESATEYHNRAARIVAGLRPSELLDSESFQELVVHHYVTGIWSHELRSDVDAFVKNCDRGPTLDTVARRHKSLQLAMELERAVEKHLYDDLLVDQIQRYISILRSPMEPRPSPGGRVNYIIPVADASLLDLIRDMHDPSKMGPNQARDRYRDKLEFPKAGAGVQCDINFSAHLALHNTLLLRCYSHTDHRVRPLVLFVKHWAKMRGINTPYRGTLSSYGYVLMVLHYLVNVVQPFVCPNLQQLGPPPPPASAWDDASHPARADDTLWCRGHYVGFWRDEAAIQRLASLGQLNCNRDSVGQLLRGFFEYYAQTGHMTTYPGVRGFDWGRDVLSLRTPGGLLSKQAKGWTGAKTVVEVHNNGEGGGAGAGAGGATAIAAGPLQSPPTAGSHGHPNGKQHPAGAEVKEIRLRYLFAIEDPFELDHNVARTVTHNGIVSIRDEFRRGWRIIKAAGSPEAASRGRLDPGELLEDVSDVQMKDDRANFLKLLSDIHGLDGTSVGETI